MSDTLKCFGCKQQFRKEELVFYTPISAKIGHNYCVKCLQEKQQREKFSNKVCEIFGLKSPGPRIWTERKRLIDTYGYTDDVIVNCLDFIYNIDKKKKLSESLCLVNPTTVNRMMNYRRSEENKIKRMANMITEAEQIKPHIVPIKKKENKKQSWDSDEWLDD